MQAEGSKDTNKKNFDYVQVGGKKKVRQEKEKMNKLTCSPSSDEKSKLADLLNYI